MSLLASLLVSLLAGISLYRIAVHRQRQGLAPYDRPGFPPPGQWALLGCLATPLAVPILLWRFGWRRWIVPFVVVWVGLASLL